MSADFFTPPAAEPLSLRAGPLSVLYQDGDLRYVTLGQREIVRRLLMAVRDRNWGTVPNRLANVHLDQGADWFHIEYDVDSRQREIDFAWHATLTGTAQGTITFAFAGVARSTFWRNRLGLVALHPIRECAGAPCRVEQADGAQRETAFPDWITADRSLTDMRALAYPVQPGLWAESRFAGDVFEMEDQRNWTDASFKTYCTPVRLGFPVEVPAGTRVAQSVTLTLQGPLPPASELPSATPVLTIGQQSVGQLPRLGLGLASHGQLLAHVEVARLQALRLSHLRADLRLSAADWPAVLARAAGESQALGTGLELALHLPAEPETALRQLRAALTGLPAPVVTWLLFDESALALTDRQIEAARSQLAEAAPGADWVGGTPIYFNDLNSQRPPTEQLDGLCYSINPQSHAFDTPSLMETFEAQAATVASTQHFAPGKPVYISPVTLRPRFNPVATGPEPESLPGELPSAVDARQRQLEAAAWTVGSLQALAGTGAVASVTLYETTGWRGLMETQAGSPLPQAFPSLPGEVFPVYHVLADLAGARAAEVLSVASTQPLKAAALAWRVAARQYAIVANLTPRPLSVHVVGAGQAVRVRLLDARSAEAAASAPEDFHTQPGTIAQPADGHLLLALPPYALAFLETVE